MAFPCFLVLTHPPRPPVHNPARPTKLKLINQLIKGKFTQKKKNKKRKYIILSVGLRLRQSAIGPGPLNSGLVSFLIQRQASSPVPFLELCPTSRVDIPYFMLQNIRTVIRYHPRHRSIIVLYLISGDFNFNSSCKLELNTNI